MRMRIYHNYENNELSAYVLADEGRALSGQKKGIREALPECVAKMRKLCVERAAAATAMIYVDGYGVIAVTWYNGLMAPDVRLHAGSRERLCNRKLVRNKDVEASDGLAAAFAAVLRSEAACRRANDLETAPRFEYPVECRDCKRAATWQGTRWTYPRPLVEALAYDAGTDADMADNDAQAEAVVVEPVEVEHGDVVDVELAETSDSIPVVEAEPRAVGSVPTLPAECEAVTQEIPEVPPQINEDARVLAVSEAVIPSGMRVAEMFPSVPWRAVRAFKRVVAHADGTVSKKKVAYAFRVGDVVQVLRRDRYVEAGADRAVESEIAAYVAKLRQAA